MFRNIKTPLVIAASVLIGGAAGWKIGSSKSDNDLDTKKTSLSGLKIPTLSPSRSQYNFQTTSTARNKFQSPFQTVIDQLYPELSEKYSKNLTRMLTNCDKDLREKIIARLSKGDISPSLFTDNPENFLEQLHNTEELRKDLNDSNKFVSLTPVEARIDEDTGFRVGILAQLTSDLILQNKIPADILIRMLNKEDITSANALISSVLKSEILKINPNLSEEHIAVLTKLEKDQTGFKDMDVLTYLKEASQDPEKMKNLATFLENTKLVHDQVADLPKDLKTNLFQLSPQRALALLEIHNTGLVTATEMNQILELYGTGELSYSRNEFFDQIKDSLTSPESIQELKRLGSLHASNQKIAENLGFTNFPYTLKEFNPEYAQSVLVRLEGTYPKDRQAAESTMKIILAQDGESSKYNID